MATGQLSAIFYETHYEICRRILQERIADVYICVPGDGVTGAGVTGLGVTGAGVAGLVVTGAGVPGMIPPEHSTTGSFSGSLVPLHQHLQSFPTKPSPGHCFSAQ